MCANQGAHNACRFARIRFWWPRDKERVVPPPWWGLSPLLGLRESRRGTRSLLLQGSLHNDEFAFLAWSSRSHCRLPFETRIWQCTSGPGTQCRKIPHPRCPSEIFRATSSERSASSWTRPPSLRGMLRYAKTIYNRYLPRHQTRRPSI